VGKGGSSKVKVIMQAEKETVQCAAG